MEHDRGDAVRTRSSVNRNMRNETANFRTETSSSLGRMLRALKQKIFIEFGDKS